VLKNICREIYIPICKGGIGLRIAVCDDSEEDLAHLCSLVERTKLAEDVCRYRHTSELLGAYHAGERQDLIFLDIEMEKPNGFEAAQALKDAGSEALVVFVTVTDQYVFRGYEVAWRYVRKPAEYAVIAKLLVEVQTATAPTLVRFQTTDGLKTFSLKDIRYIEAERNTICIHTAAGDYFVRMTMKAAERYIGSTLFIKPHVSYLVNGNFIDKVKDATITMQGGGEIPIAHGRKGAFLDAYRICIRDWS
jgi:DNA-binding LytR/AlgR family response regulator